MNQTLKGLAAAANAPYNLAYSVVATLIGAVCATAFIIKFFGPSFQTWVNRRLGLTGKTAFTQYAISYATIGAVADELNSMGGIAVTQATNMISSAQQMFTTQSLPQMQTLQAGLQADLATLTGLELLAAQEMISLLTYEMAYIPTTLLIPPLAVP